MNSTYVISKTFDSRKHRGSHFSDLLLPQDLYNMFLLTNYEPFCFKQRRFLLEGELIKGNNILPDTLPESPYTFMSAVTPDSKKSHSQGGIVATASSVICRINYKGA